MNITIQAALEQKKALDDFDKPGAGIHIYNVKGCCGPSFQMDIATPPKPMIQLSIWNMFINRR
jgi:hypothetical protein